MTDTDDDWVLAAGQGIGLIKGGNKRATDPSPTNCLNVCYFH